MMSDVLPSSNKEVTSVGLPQSKNQVAIERLKCRMENYRDHQELRTNHYDTTMNTYNTQHLNETLILRKRFLESSKSKKSTKKSATAISNSSKLNSNSNEFVLPHATNGLTPSSSSQYQSMKRSIEQSGSETDIKSWNGEVPSAKRSNNTSSDLSPSPSPSNSVKTTGSPLSVTSASGIQIKRETVTPPSVAPSSNEAKNKKEFNLHEAPRTCSPSSVRVKTEFKEESKIGQSGGDDTLGDLDIKDFIVDDDMMNPDTLNDLINDLQDIPNDFIDTFDFSDRDLGSDFRSGQITSMSNVIVTASSNSGSICTSNATNMPHGGFSEKINCSGNRKILPNRITNSFDISSSVPNLSEQNFQPSQSYHNAGNKQPEMSVSCSTTAAAATAAANAAERLKIMAQQHQAKTGPPNIGQNQMTSQRGSFPGSKLCQDAPPVHKTGASNRSGVRRNTNVSSGVPSLPTMPLPMSSPPISPPLATNPALTAGSCFQYNSSNIRMHCNQSFDHNSQIAVSQMDPMQAGVGTVRSRPQNRYRMGIPRPNMSSVNQMPQNAVRITQSGGVINAGGGGNIMQPRIVQGQIVVGGAPMNHNPMQQHMQGVPMGAMGTMPMQQQQMIHQQNVRQMQPSDMRSHQEHMMIQRMQMQHQMQLQQQTGMNAMRNSQHVSDTSGQMIDDSYQMITTGVAGSGPVASSMTPQQMRMQQIRMQQMQQQQIHNRPPPPEYGKMMQIQQQHQAQNQGMSFMMGGGAGGGGQMNLAAGSNVRFAGVSTGPMVGPRAFARGQSGFQQIPPSGPMIKQQPQNGMGLPVGGGQIRMPMMGSGQNLATNPSSTGGASPASIPLSHPSPNSSLWVPGGPNNACSGGGGGSGSGSPSSAAIAVQQCGSPMQVAMGSPRTPGEQNHGSPMMSNVGIRSQGPVGGTVMNQPNVQPPNMMQRIPPQSMAVGGMNSRGMMQHGQHMVAIQQHSPMNNHNSPIHHSAVGAASPMGSAGGGMVLSPQHQMHMHHQQNMLPQQQQNMVPVQRNKQEDFNLDFLDQISTGDKMVASEPNPEEAELLSLLS